MGVGFQKSDSRIKISEFQNGARHPALRFARATPTPSLRSEFALAEGGMRGEGAAP